MLTTEAVLKRIIKGAAVCVVACLLTACAFQTGVCGKDPTGKLTYYIASIREKKIQGNWGERAQWVQRQETADGRWALEWVVLGEKDEGKADAKMLDSAGTVIWEGRVYDRIVLSPVAPAFAATSSEGGGLELYNLQVGPKPLFSVPPGSDAGAHLSRDGTVFGIATEGAITMVSLRGEMLHQIKVPDSLSGLSIAIADSGRYVAFGGTDTPVPTRGPADSLHTTTVWVPDSLGPAVRRGTGPGHYAEESRLGISRPHPRVVVLDQAGKQVGQIKLDGTLPHNLALSGNDPPEVCVVSHHYVTLWTSDGRRIWEDSLSLATADGREGLKAMYLTDDGRLIAVTVRSETTATLWAWERGGVLEMRLPLPAALRVQRSRASFVPPSDTAIGLQVETAVTLIRWQSASE